MTITVTLRVFSGRPDPSWTLSEAQEEEFEARLQGLAERALEKPPGGLGGLGYRGLIISRPDHDPGGPLSILLQAGVADPGPVSASLRDPERAVERWLVETGADRLLEPVIEHVRASLEALPTAPAAAPRVDCPPCLAPQAPAYTPVVWNAAHVQPYNNCYNYANNQITNTFAQPGRASGHPLATIGCAVVGAAAASDGLAPAGGFDHSIGLGWYVALVVWPNMDFHWYRQDSNGCWSHKPGQSPATNLDAAGYLIADPQTASRGPYVNFCGYMVTSNGVHIN